MKNLTVTVNGVAYNVTVEENTNGAAPCCCPGCRSGTRRCTCSGCCTCRTRCRWFCSCQRSHAGHHPGHQGQGRRCC